MGTGPQAGGTCLGVGQGVGRFAESGGFGAVADSKSALCAACLPCGVRIPVPLAAHVRAADGRGPLWWAHEHKNEEAIELLQAAGCDEEAQDRGVPPRLYHPLTFIASSVAVAPSRGPSNTFPSWLDVHTVG